MVERFNRTLNEMLCSSAKENPQSWDKYVPLLAMAYRATPHESTGFSPNYLVFGREHFMPVDVMMGTPSEETRRSELDYVKGLRDKLEDAYVEARESLQVSANRQKWQCDLRACEKPYC